MKNAGLMLEFRAVPSYTLAGTITTAAFLFVAHSAFADIAIPPPPPPKPTVTAPVIIIPGILGSEQHNDEWVIDPILHTYDDLIATLDANGYTPDLDLFTFPYDWRQSNIDTALLLKERIDEAKDVCSCDKVDLVAHSMGGLVARQYIQSDAYENDVRKLIFLGTPHLGAPKAYLMWEGGEYNPGLLPIEDSLTERMLKHEASESEYPSLFDYVRTAPIDSVKQLLPVYDYIFDGNNLRQYSNSYPRNTFLENLNGDIQSLFDSGVSIFNVIGETGTSETIIGIQSTDPAAYLPKWEHGYPEEFSEIFGDHGLVKGGGDKTVPTASASFVNENVEITPFAHVEIPSGAEGRIYQILTGKSAGTLVHNLNIPNIKMLLIKMLSPADLLVVAPDGKKIGKDFATGQEVNEILNAFYTGFTTDTEFITILNPLDGEYKIFNQGTGSGEYGIEVAYMSEGENVDTSFTGQTKPSLTTELNLVVDNENPETIEITLVDVEPPIITIGKPESKDYLHSAKLPVDVSAQDLGSGVSALETFIDDSPIPNVGSIDLFFQPLGAHTILASSTDKAGNATTSIRTFRVIATSESTQADMDRVYALKWINIGVYKALSEQLRATKKTPPLVAKRLLQAMLNQLKLYRGKLLNEQGYRILKADIEWLINN